jgi:hypothetical protein
MLGDNTSTTIPLANEEDSQTPHFPYIYKIVKKG